MHENAAPLMPRTIDAADQSGAIRAGGTMQLLLPAFKTSIIHSHIKIG